MKNKAELFKLLRESVEDEREAKIVADLINKIELKMPPIEIVDETHLKFDGVIYREDKRNAHYTSHIYLHRLVWNYFHGEIPIGFEIHHDDFNPANNDITNLKMLTKEEHRKLHGKARRRLIVKQCLVCGKNFTSYKFQKRKYCSKKCSDEARKKTRKIVIKKCPICGKTFESHVSIKTKYCSYTCAGIAHTIKNTEIRICPVCKKRFQIGKARKKIYCSRSCSLKSRWKKITNEFKVCQFCGKDFESRKFSNRKYCSQACAHEARRKNESIKIPVS